MYYVSPLRTQNFAKAFEECVKVFASDLPVKAGMLGGWRATSITSVAVWNMQLDKYVPVKLSRLLHTFALLM